MISAGEASGDLHAANLVKALRKHQANLSVCAMGADLLRAEGAEILVDCRAIAVMGIVEVLKHWRDIQAALQRLKDEIDNNPPDLLILVDYVEFNLKLAKYAKDKGVKVLFYVSPQVWAWRSGRVPKIGKAIDMMAVLFPFETEVYEKSNVPVRFVGHPLADEVKPTMGRSEAQQVFNLHPDMNTVALLPGSRKSEVERILPVLLQSAVQIKKASPNIQFILPIAPTLCKEYIRQFIDNVGIEVILINAQTHDVVACSDAVIVASGTATLEVALLEKPMSIVYKTNPISYSILSRMIKVEHIGLANIVAGKGIVPEFIQDYAEPHIIAAEVLKQLEDEHYRSTMINELSKVKIKLAAGGGSSKIAALAHEMLEGQH